ncbi:MAG: hypothetical protein KDE35_02830 [Geminicoccaceae bacterium]|nr:hypothetical protein [Geminicoccaceae bacterium]
MALDREQLQLEPHPTAASEQRQFSNPDEIRADRDNAHALALIDREQGLVGRIIGSTEANLNIACTIILFAGLGMLGSMVGMFMQPELFFDALKLFTTVLLTVAGYVFGVKSRSD